MHVWMYACLYVCRIIHSYCMSSSNILVFHASTSRTRSECIYANAWACICARLFSARYWLGGMYQLSRACFNVYIHGHWHVHLRKHMHMHIYMYTAIQFERVFVSVTSADLGHACTHTCTYTHTYRSLSQRSVSWSSARRAWRGPNG
jgi:hypothetical protein